MVNMKEALRVRAELALWSGRKAVHQPRLKSLQSRYILEQDDVNRMQRGLFSKLKRNYNEKLEQEMAEVEAAKAEWEKMTALMKTADEKLLGLELQAKAFVDFWETAESIGLRSDEKALLDWCERMEQGKIVVMETNACISLAQEAMRGGGLVEESPLPILQRKAEVLHRKANQFFEDLQMEERLPSWESMLFYLYTVQSIGSNYGRNSVEDIQLAVASNNALFNLDQALKDLRERLAEIMAEVEKEGEALLQRMGSGESHFCEKDMFEVQEMPAMEEKLKEEISVMPVFEGVGLFGQVDLSKEKERVLFGLDLLRKEFEKITPENDRLSGWERALREWQQDLKQYRKNAGNFPCALDKYEILEKKIWQYTEKDAAELQQAYREHLQDTAERLAQAEEQIRTHEK